MPNLHSAVKRMRLAEAARQRNRAIKAKVSTMRRQLFESVANQDLEKAKLVYSDYSSSLDRAAKRGVIKKNTAIRRKRRAAAKLVALKKVD